MGMREEGAREKGKGMARETTLFTSRRGDPVWSPARYRQ